MSIPNCNLERSCNFSFSSFQEKTGLFVDDDIKDTLPVIESFAMFVRMSEILPFDLYPLSILSISISQGPLCRSSQELTDAALRELVAQRQLLRLYLS